MSTVYSLINFAERVRERNLHESMGDIQLLYMAEIICWINGC
uniref:Uncharacterized protein n=1 Tax=Rhizophora mucronata TaxID=61149 RepID=A0A2P2NDZ9_RHIMU